MLNPGPISGPNEVVSSPRDNINRENQRMEPENTLYRGDDSDSSRSSPRESQENLLGYRSIIQNSEIVPESSSVEGVRRGGNERILERRNGDMEILQIRDDFNRRRDDFNRMRDDFNRMRDDFNNRRDYINNLMRKIGRAHV